ncbi:N-6 DNA methylase [Streptomyces sp. NPDC006356]
MSDRNVKVGDVRSRLRAAGYTLLQSEPRLEKLPNFRPDVLAWASNADGDLVPWAVVELKSRLRQPEFALPALARSRDLMGTVEHYAVINGEWFKADRGVRSLEPVDGPTPPAYGSQGRLTDEGLATSLLVQRLWFEANRLRDAGVRVGDAFPSGTILAQTARPGIELPEGAFLPVRPDVLWRAKREALIEFASRGSSGSSSHPAVASAVAALVEKRLTGTVLDPFCGTGSFLWATLDRAADRDIQARFVGYEINPQLADLAAGIGHGAPSPVAIDKADAFRTDFPAADVIVTAPPVHTRTEDRQVLLDGSTTTDGDVVAVDKGLRALTAGGRAVFHLASGFTSAERHASYRTFLAHEFRVAALIGLPRGALSGTGVRSVLMVIDRAEPSQTFVAQLGEDWETQLEPEGAALSAALEFVDSAATPRVPGQP